MGYTGVVYSNLDELCAALGTQPATITYYANNLGNHIRLKTTTKSDGSPRQTLAPSRELKDIQRRIKEVFFADYQFSDHIYGLGGDTLRDHALAHAGDNNLVKMDITDFFPSITHTAVYKMWYEVFGQPAPVARVLTKLATHNGHLQQGFPTSSHVAAVVALPVTTQLYDHCQEHGMGFTQYVDDLNFSGQNIEYRDIFKLTIDTARQHGFSIKRKKTKVYPATSAKRVTGVALQGSQTRAPKQVRQKAYDALKAYQADPTNKSLERQLNGYIGHIRHLNKADGDNLKRLKNY